MTVTPRGNAAKTKTARAKAYSIANGKCIYCLRELEPGQGALDHVIPLSQGGSDCQSNLVLACRRCNTKKGSLTPAQFIALLAEEARDAAQTIYVTRPCAACSRFKELLHG
jgi:5-methylcytosine-specific restriction endonuclease McrA